MTASGLVIDAVVAGVVATATFDLWQRAQKLAFGVPPSNWALVGRWFAHIPSGRLVHDSIQTAAPAPHEEAIGWTAHYAVGIAYAAMYLSGAHALGATPSLASAVAFGVVTVVAAWFVLQPGMGMGVLARKAPNPGEARLRSLLNHVVFGVGLYLGSLVAGLTQTPA